MAEGGIDERQSFGNLARSLKKYGSTCNHVKKPPDNSSYCRHEVEEGDTLQGLALKYGVTMEQIRRVNRLWASDSLFVRETLLIPAPPQGTMLSPGGFSADSGHSSDGSDEPSTSAILREQSRPVQARDQSDSSLSDFLGKIDSSIARTKNQVAKHRGSSDHALVDSSSRFWTGTDVDDVPPSRRKPAVSRLRQNCSSQPEVLTSQPSRKMRSSLQRLEAAQDEMFEL